MRVVPDVTTVNVVGDSHAEVTFRNVLLQRDAETINTETVYIESIEAAKFYENGEVIRPILTSLSVQRILLANRIKGDNGDVSFHLRAHPLSAGRPTLFSVGDNDLRGILLAQIASYDFRIPWRSDSEQPPPVPSLKAAPFEQIDDFVRKLLTPYLTGLEYLRALGLKRLAVLSIAPPTIDDDEYARFNGYRTHLYTRYRAALLMNDTLRKLATQSGFAFIDIWGAVTERGYLNPRYYLDGTHLNRQAAAVAIETLLSPGAR
jgi:lysophospholipase L1-like esterase